MRRILPEARHPLLECSVKKTKRLEGFLALEHHAPPSTIYRRAQPRLKEHYLALAIARIPPMYFHLTDADLSLSGIPTFLRPE
jgi:hypothetical protein